MKKMLCGATLVAVLALFAAACTAPPTSAPTTTSPAVEETTTTTSTTVPDPEQVPDLPRTAGTQLVEHGSCRVEYTSFEYPRNGPPPSQVRARVLSDGCVSVTTNLNTYYASVMEASNPIQHPFFFGTPCHGTVTGRSVTAVDGPNLPQAAVGPSTPHCSSYGSPEDRWLAASSGVQYFLNGCVQITAVDAPGVKNARIGSTPQPVKEGFGGAMVFTPDPCADGRLGDVNYDNLIGCIDWNLIVRVMGHPNPRERNLDGLGVIDQADLDLFSTLPFDGDGATCVPVT